MKKILMILAVVGMMGTALMTQTTPAAASCSFTGILAPNCAGTNNTCYQFWFGVSGTATVDLQRKIGTTWTTVATTISSGYIYCPPNAILGSVEFRLVGHCSNGATFYGYPGAITCP